MGCRQAQPTMKRSLAPGVSWAFQALRHEWPLRHDRPGTARLMSGSRSTQRRDVSQSSAPASHPRSTACCAAHALALTLPLRLPPSVETAAQPGPPACPTPALGGLAACRSSQSPARRLGSHGPKMQHDRCRRPTALLITCGPHPPERCRPWRANLWCVRQDARGYGLAMTPSRWMRR